jgi:DNA gyrase/topoisomerase IV subunit A
MDDVIGDVKTSGAMHRIEEELNELISKTGTIIENKESSMHLVEDQTTNLKKEFQDMRERIEEKMSMIREQFKKMENKIYERKTEYETKTNDAITKLKENMRTAQNLRVTIAQIKESASNLQIFLCLKELETMLSKEENRLSTILEKGVLDNMTLRFIPSEQLEKLTSIGCIGDIECETKPLDICFGSHGQSVKKTESKQPHFIDIDEVKLEMRTEMSFTDTTKVTNCVVLHNGSMLFTDFSDKSRLILYDANGNFLRHIKVESNPFDLVVINESVVAVTLLKANKVLFIDLDHDNVVKSFSTVGKCYGIDHVANRIAVSVKGIGIQIFDDEGTHIKTMSLACTALVFLKSNICYVKVGSNVLRCCDLEGNNMWELKLPVDKFYNYPSMTSDEYGNIYITERDSNQVFIVAEDGARYRKLLQESDGLDDVSGIFINTKKQQLLVCTERDEMAVLYDILIQPRDEDL